MTVAHQRRSCLPRQFVLKRIGKPVDTIRWIVAGSGACFTKYIGAMLWRRQYGPQLPQNGSWR